jgi:hypothetical protein
MARCEPRWCCPLTRMRRADCGAASGLRARARRVGRDRRSHTLEPALGPYVELRLTLTSGPRSSSVRGERHSSTHGARRGSTRRTASAVDGSHRESQSSHPSARARARHAQSAPGHRATMPGRAPRARLIAGSPRRNRATNARLTARSRTRPSIPFAEKKAGAEGGLTGLGGDVDVVEVADEVPAAAGAVRRLDEPLEATGGSGDIGGQSRPPSEPARRARAPLGPSAKPEEGGVKRLRGLVSVECQPTSAQRNEPQATSAASTAPQQSGVTTILLAGTAHPIGSARGVTRPALSASTALGVRWWGGLSDGALCSPTTAVVSKAAMCSEQTATCSESGAGRPR